MSTRLTGSAATLVAVLAFCIALVAGRRPDGALPASQNAILKT